jgi:ATP-dependent protease ClpP protease subunit
MERNLDGKVGERVNAKPFFRASMGNDGVLEMLVYEQIGEDFWSGTGVTAASVRAQIDRAGIYASILVRINSPGGDAFEGIAIGNVLKATGKPVNVCIDGIAASAASIIAMAGTTITMASNAMMMIHKASSFAYGNADDFLSTSTALAKIDGSLAQTYVDKTGKAIDDILAMMAAETWMSAADCLRDGFCTAIAGADEDEGEAMNMARRFKALERFQKVPKSLKLKASAKCARDCKACMDGDCPSCSNPDCTDTHCQDRPMQNDADNSATTPSNLSLFKAKQWLLDHGQS